MCSGHNQVYLCGCRAEPKITVPCNYYRIKYPRCSTIRPTGPPVPLGHKCSWCRFRDETETPEQRRLREEQTRQIEEQRRYRDAVEAERQRMAREALANLRDPRRRW